MKAVDWLIVLVYMALSLLIGLYYTRRASSSLNEFFLSGRNLPWWLAGTSMVATTFSSDTPLYVTGLVREHGVYENWQWWSFIMSGMLSVFFFSRLWRRLGVLTDVELINLRYSGREASILRGFKALYFSLIIHTIIKAQVILAMAKIMDAAVGWGKWKSIVISSLVTIAYSTMSGYWGVVTTDFFQFIIAMIGAVVLAWVSLGRAGGVEGLKAGIPPETMGFFPSPGEAAFMTFLGYIALSWWSKYSSDGGGVIVQRMASSKDERQSFAATFYFNVANYSLRTWPWVIAALASLILYPAVADHEAVYPRMMMDLLPAGLKGLVLASFFAAFMSTLSTYLNLSSAYFINDLYRPFVRPHASEKHYLAASRIITLVLSGVTAVVTYYVTSIVGVFKFLIAFGSGTGLVYILRWFWWRINAWSEISAMAASTAATVIAYKHPALAGSPFYAKLAFIISSSTAVWVVVTFLTRPVPMEKLAEFYRRTLPGGFGWLPVRRHVGDTESGRFRGAFAQWVFGCVFLIALTMGSGKLLLGFYAEGLAWGAAAVFSGSKLWRWLSAPG
jgi:Na+/proline symporter